MKFNKFIFKNSRKIIGSALLLSMMMAQTVGAATTTSDAIRSTGNIEYDADNNGTADVLFYSNDLKVIADGVDTIDSKIATLSANYTTLTNQVTTYKTNIITGMNANVRKNNALPATASFDDIIAAINAVQTKNAETFTPGTADQTIAANQFLLGAQTIKGDADLAAGNIKTGVQIFDVTGTFTSDANAVAGEILDTKTAYVNGNKVTGNMPNKGAWTSTGATANATTTKNIPIPAGYHNGNGYVQLASLKDQTGVDSGKKSATAAALLTGYQAWVDGAKVTGSMSDFSGTANQPASGNSTMSTYTSGSTTYLRFQIPATGYYTTSNYLKSNIVSRGTLTNATLAAGTIPAGYYTGDSITRKDAKTYTPGTSNQVIAANQFLKGAQTIAGDGDLVAANIKKGVDIFGVVGTFTSDATATADQIMSGYTAYVNGAKVTGTKTLSGMTSGDAAAGDILKNKTAWVNGTKLTGSMANYGTSTAQACTLANTSNVLYVKPNNAGYYSSSSSFNTGISYNPNKTVAGFSGSAGSATADGATSASTIVLGSNKQVTIPSGYYTSATTVKNGGGVRDTCITVDLIHHNTASSGMRLQLEFLQQWKYIQLEYYNFGAWNGYPGFEPSIGTTKTLTSSLTDDLSFSTIGGTGDSGMITVYVHLTNS